MPIPFRDLTEDAGIGLAAYLRFVEEPDGKGVRGALFYMSAAGEPVDFSYCRIELHPSLLWRPGQAKERAVATLAKSLFGASRREPALLLARAEEVSSRTFTDDLEVQIPLCRVAGNGAPAEGSGESIESLGDTSHLCWVNGVPAPQSEARRLLERLRARELVTEPFDRMASGLEEAFKQQ